MMPNKLGRVGMVLESWFYTLNMEAPAGMVGMVVVVVVREQAARTESSQAVSSWGNGHDGDEGDDDGDEYQSLAFIFLQKIPTDT